MSRNLVTKLVLVLSILSIFVISDYSGSICQTKSCTSLVGTWQGALEFNGNKLRIIFHIAKTDSGTLTGSIDSPDQGAKGLPISNLILTQDSVRLVMASIGGEFAGHLSANNSSIEGKWVQGGISLPLTVARTTEEIEYNRPQEPKPPYPYKSKEVSFESESTGMKYAGTLTLPDSGGPFPAVILITGSGHHDRNEEILGHKPFLAIADYLTRRGIAVLRVDDRGVGGSTGNKSEATSADHAKDVIAEAEYLKDCDEINPKKIGLIGHSEGGIIAPMVAAKSKDISLIVLLAAPGTTGEKILLDQTRRLEEASNIPDGKISQDVAHLKEILNIIKSGTDSVAIADKIHSCLKETFAGREEEFKKSGVDPEKAIDGQIRIFDSPWYRYFVKCDPKRSLKKVKCPVLAMDGALDMQVPAEENLKAIEDALKKGGNKDYTIKLMSGLNHLFQDAKTGNPSEYAQIEETFSPEALKVMGDWVAEKTGKK